MIDKPMTQIKNKGEEKMEEITKCLTCKHYQGLIEVPNGYPGLTKEKIDCFKFGYLELLINFETCKLFERKE